MSLRMTDSEVQEIYSPEPFSYDFEALLSWSEPYTLPVVPPNIESLSYDDLYSSARHIAQQLIDKTEASLPTGTPGLENYLNKKYADIDKHCTDKASRLQIKNKFLSQLQAKINSINLVTDEFMGVHIYLEDDYSLSENFAIRIGTYIGDDDYRYYAQYDIYNLLRSLTAAQVEIVLGRSLKKIHHEIRKVRHEITLTTENNDVNGQALQAEITLNPNSLISLSATTGTIDVDHPYYRKLEKHLEKAMRALKVAGETAVTRLFRAGIGALLYSPSLGNSDLYDDSALFIPADLIIPNLPSTIYDAALKEGTFDSPYRISITNDIFTLRKNLNSKDSASKVPIRPLVFDQETNSFTSIPSEEFPTRLIFPTQTSNDSSTTTPNRPKGPSPYRGVELTPLHIEATPLPLTDIPNFSDCVYCFPPESGLPPLYVVFNSPYPGATTIGTYSGRPYNPEKAGGPIERLDWRDAQITAGGVELVKLHIGRFLPSDANKVMIERLERILQGTLQITDTDKRFFTHEIRELERFRALGIADKILPTDRGETWNNTHAATLEDYQLGSDAELLYTAEALEADAIQLERENP